MESPVYILLVIWFFWTVYEIKMSCYVTSFCIIRSILYFIYSLILLGKFIIFMIGLI